MIGSWWAFRPLLSRVSPRALCVASRSLSKSFNTCGFNLPNINSHVEPSQGLLQLRQQCWNITSFRSYGRNYRSLFLLYNWCTYDISMRVAREHLIAETYPRGTYLTATYLKECQRRLPGHMQLPPGWLEAIQKRLMMMQNLSSRDATTLLDAFEQIQLNCCPTHTQRPHSFPVAKRLFRLWFDPPKKCIGLNELVACLELRAMGLRIDPGDLDARFWPWFWKVVHHPLYERKDARRIIDDTIRCENPAQAAGVLHSLAKIEGYKLALKVQHRTLRFLTKQYVRLFHLSALSIKQLVVGAWFLAQLGSNPATVDGEIWTKFFERLDDRMMNQLEINHHIMLITVIMKFELDPSQEWLNMFLDAIYRKLNKQEDRIRIHRHLKQLEQYFSNRNG